MNYDLDFRYRRALQPDGLATIPTATQAVVDAMQDARNAGIDPARDPARPSCSPAMSDALRWATHLI